MGVEMMLAHFQTLVRTPADVERLNEAILDLAVRGKLGTQNASDEPASVLLKRIRMEKKKMEAAGEIRGSKTLSPVKPGEAPYDLPPGWVWCRFDDIAERRVGKTPPTKEPRYWDDSGHCWVSISDMTQYGIVADTGRKVSDLAARTMMNGKLATKGTLLMSLKLTIGKVSILGIDAYHNEAIISIYPFGEMSQDYLFRFLPIFTMIGDTKAAIKGATLNAKSLAALPIPLPPLAEQKRIVARVDALLAGTAVLKASLAQAEAERSTLRAAALHRLESAADPTQAQAAWSLIQHNFAALMATAEDVAALKQSILQLAVQGKLVLQDPTDEPASELLKRIRAEKARLEEAGEIRKSKALPRVKADEVPFAVPDGWAWSRVGEVVEIGTGATPRRGEPKYWEEGTIPWITSAATGEEFIRSASEYVSPLALQETNLTVYPVHTLIVAMYGQGKTRGQISELLLPATTNQACAALIAIINADALRKYVKLFFVKHYQELRNLAEGGAQPNLNLSKIRDSLIPLPPLAEQVRIVARVEALFGLCDSLAAELSAGEGVRARWVSAVLGGGWG